jgi:hypothetical protein
MRGWLRCWLAPIALALCGALPSAFAGDDTDFKGLHPNAGQGIIQPSPAPADAGDKAEKPPPTFAYFAAVAAALVVLCILCAPSRKAESSTSRR